MADVYEKQTDEADQAVIAVAPAEPEEKTRPRHDPRKQTRTSTRRQPNWHVVIWNDDEHTYEYVVELLMTLFGHPFEMAYQITYEVDHAGRGIAYTCHQELAELKRDLILGYGADWRMDNSRGPIRATIEEAPE